MFAIKNLGFPKFPLKKFNSLIDFQYLANFPISDSTLGLVFTGSFCGVTGGG